MLSFTCTHLKASLFYSIKLSSILGYFLKNAETSPERRFIASTTFVLSLLWSPPAHLLFYLMYSRHATPIFNCQVAFHTEQLSLLTFHLQNLKRFFRDPATLQFLSLPRLNIRFVVPFSLLEVIFCPQLVLMVFNTLFNSDFILDLLTSQIKSLFHCTTIAQAITLRKIEWREAL